MTTTPVSGGFGFPLGMAIAIVVTIVMVAAGATHHPDRAVLALAVVIALTAMITTPAATFGTTAVAWFLVAGFVIGRFGQVSVSPTAGWAAIALTVVALATTAMAGALRARPHRTTTD
jgi:hypothetical protein